MTPIILMDSLEEFIRNATKSIILPCRVRNDLNDVKERPAEVFKMNLPKKEDEKQRVPYILLQFIKGIDEREEGKYPLGSCSIRIVVVTYSEDRGTGEYDVLNIILKIRSELEKTGCLDCLFDLLYPLEYLIYDGGETYPYYVGEMMTNWSLPVPRIEKC